MTKFKDCIYCDDKNESTHFICARCTSGMCDDCYNGITEHDGHINEICEHAEYPEAYIINGCEPAYLCDECINVMAQEYYNKHNIKL